MYYLKNTAANNTKKQKKQRKIKTHIKTQFGPKNDMTLTSIPNHFTRIQFPFEKCKAVFKIEQPSEINEYIHNKYKSNQYYICNFISVLDGFHFNIYIDQIKYIYFNCKFYNLMKYKKRKIGKIMNPNIDYDSINICIEINYPKLHDTYLSSNYLESGNEYVKSDLDENKTLKSAYVILKNNNVFPNFCLRLSKEYYNLYHKILEFHKKMIL